VFLLGQNSYFIFQHGKCPYQFFTGLLRVDYLIHIAAIVSAKPREVVVAYDNDLTGQASGAMYRMLLDRWRNEIKERTGLFPKKDREPVGPLVANQLNAAGVKAYLMPWPKHAPEAADLGWLFAQS
jgi:hypothetical protein